MRGLFGSESRLANFRKGESSLWIGGGKTRKDSRFNLSLHRNSRFPCFPLSRCLILDVQAKITGPEELYVKRGSTISLTCIVDVQDIPPSNVTWYHAGAMIDFDGPRCVWTFRLCRNAKKKRANEEEGETRLTKKSEAGSITRLGKRCIETNFTNTLITGNFTQKPSHITGYCLVLEYESGAI